MHRKTLTAILIGGLVLILGTICFGFNKAWFIFSSLTYIPYTITGIVMSITGIHKIKFGSVVYALVSVTLTILSLNISG